MPASHVTRPPPSDHTILHTPDRRLGCALMLGLPTALCRLTTSCGATTSSRTRRAPTGAGRTVVPAPGGGLRSGHGRSIAPSVRLQRPDLRFVRRSDNVEPICQNRQRSGSVSATDRSRMPLAVSPLPFRRVHAKWQLSRSIRKTPLASDFKLQTRPEEEHVELHEEIDLAKDHGDVLVESPRESETNRSEIRYFCCQ